MAMRACRSCGSSDLHPVVDLGMSPLCERYVRAEDLDRMEPFYPLQVRVCGGCLLVQLDQYVLAEQAFDDYGSSSSSSSVLLDHARRYVEEAVIRHDLGPDCMVLELGSNDGSLLRWFVERGIPCLGIEPAADVAAAAASELGVPTEVSAFGVATAAELADRGVEADLIVANNVLTEVPHLNDFVGGIPLVLAPKGTVTIEFPHVMRMLAENQFVNIDHDHFCHFSLLSASTVLASHGLTVFDVEELWTHGGSLRLHVRHCHDASRPVTERVRRLASREEGAGLHDVTTYARFEDRVRATKRALLQLLIAARDEECSIVGYGAPGTGNMLLNYCGIRTDLLGFTVDRNPKKQGRYLPGTHVPILAPEALDEARPDFVLVLLWNLRNEIMAQLAHVREWGGRFIVPIPRAAVI